MDCIAVPDICYHALPGFQPTLSAQLWLVIYDGQVVINDQGGHLWCSLDEFADYQTAIVTGYLDDVPVAVVELSWLKAGMARKSIRSLLSLSETVYAHFSHSLQILTSRNELAFCGYCGHRKQPKVGEWAMLCPQCGHHTYPRISPCVIVLVTRGDEMLLVRHHRHGKDATMHTLVAGFIEPGESAEQAVHREVQEETGLTLGRLKYCFSQSWPFPHSLMMGFHAEYECGELVLDDDELCSAAWFHRHNLPELPPDFTIAGKLVHFFL